MRTRYQRHSVSGSRAQCCGRGPLLQSTAQLGQLRIVPESSGFAHALPRRFNAHRRRRAAHKATSESSDFFLQHLPQPGDTLSEITVVYKFGGSSVADAQRMREVAEIICAFQDEKPCVVMSAMGRTTNLLLEAGAQAIEKDTESIPGLKPLREIKALHRDTCDTLDLDSSAVASIEKLLVELQQLLTALSIMQEVTPRAKDSLVSFGERLSTRVFASYLARIGVRARQFDAWDLGLTTSDEFTNAEICYEESMPSVAENLKRHAAEEGSIPVITGFLGRGTNTGAITTLGRGGSDLSATFVGAALGVREVIVWKDVDGVLTSDPRIVRDARVIRELTYEEATELAYFGAQVLHPSAMFPAQASRDAIQIRVRNSYNLDAPGSVIASARDFSDTLLTSIVLKPDVHLLDIVSTRMLGNFGFLGNVFDIFREEEISVDVVATSEISVSVTLDCARLWSRDLIAEELDNLAAKFKGIATVAIKDRVSIISLICNASRSSTILAKVFERFDDLGINVKMISQGASKTNISLIVPNDVADNAVKALHAEFFGITAACAASSAALNKDSPASVS